MTDAELMRQMGEALRGLVIWANTKGLGPTAFSAVHPCRKALAAYDRHMAEQTAAEVEAIRRMMEEGNGAH